MSKITPYLIFHLPLQAPLPFVNWPPLCFNPILHLPFHWDQLCCALQKPGHHFLHQLDHLGDFVILGTFRATACGLAPLQQLYMHLLCCSWIQHWVWCWQGWHGAVASGDGCAGTECSSKGFSHSQHAMAFDIGHDLGGEMNDKLWLARQLQRYDVWIWWSNSNGGTNSSPTSGLTASTRFAITTATLLHLAAARRCQTECWQLWQQARDMHFEEPLGQWAMLSWIFFNYYFATISRDTILFYHYEIRG